MSKQFKVGDKVKCVDAGQSAKRYLEYGREYFVVETRGTRVVLNGVDHPFGSWNQNRFELVAQEAPAPKFKVGDKVKCVNLGNGTTASIYMKVGEVYEVRAVCTQDGWEGDVSLVGVPDIFPGWCVSRFELAPQEQNEFILKGKDSAGRMFDYASLGSLDECRTYLEKHGKAELTYTVTECVPRAVFAVQEEVTRCVTAV